jgi:hypothetical protein
MNNTIITEMNKIVESELKARVEAINSGLITSLKVELKQELTGVLPDNRIDDILYHNDITIIRRRIVKNFSFQLSTSVGAHDESIFELIEAVDAFKHVMKLTDSVADKILLTNELIK